MILQNINPYFLKFNNNLYTVFTAKNRNLEKLPAKVYFIVIFF